MSGEELALLFLRAMGAVWVVGAIFLLRQLWINSKLDPMIAALEKAAEDLREQAGEPPVEPKKKQPLVDNARERWLVVGALMTIVSGVAMAAGHRSAMFLLAATILHQLLYFVRQFRREKAAPDEVSAVQERPSTETVNGFYATIILTMLTAWLYYRGALS
jgi:hypothetical protein